MQPDPVMEAFVALFLYEFGQVFVAKAGDGVTLDQADSSHGWQRAYEALSEEQYQEFDERYSILLAVQDRLKEKAEGRDGGE